MGHVEKSGENELADKKQCNAERHVDSRQRKRFTTRQQRQQRFRHLV